MTDEPFQNFQFDGVIGLGLANLAVDSQFSLFEQMARSGENFVPQFGYFLSERDDVASEICFGGHDARHMRSSLQWAPVHDPHKGFWQVRILRVTVNGEVWSRAPPQAYSTFGGTVFYFHKFLAYSKLLGWKALLLHNLQIASQFDLPNVLPAAVPKISINNLQWYFGSTTFPGVSLLRGRFLCGHR